MISKGTILIVDDDQSSLRLLAKILTSQGYQVRPADSGELALTAVAAQTPELILLDIFMPGIDGFEVLRKVRAAKPDVRIIILTGHGTDATEEEAKKLGAFHYHKKPIDIDELLSTVKKAYREKIEDAMVAATFAQAGAFEEAQQILDEDKD